VINPTRPSARRAGAAALVLVATALLAGGACGGDKDDERSAAGRSVADADTSTTICDTSATAPVPSELSEGLRPPSSDAVRTATATADKVVLVVSSPAAVDDVLERYKSAVPAAGFTIDDEDDEGREAELFFSMDGRKGSLLIKRSDCPPGSTSYQLTVPTG
jgi:hypothetical protein